MKSINKIQPTENEGNGFWGTMYFVGPDVAERAWKLASISIAEATGDDADCIRAFLDSTMGRHFANETRDRIAEGYYLADAIKTAVGRWMQRSLNRQTRREMCIPDEVEGSYLALMVAAAAINDGVL